MQRADKRKFHYIYKIVRDDGKYYIGMHSTDNLEDGYFGSGKRITRSIKKHGLVRHTKTVLEFLPSRLLLKEREKELITNEVRNDDKCFNIAPGGGGGWVGNPNSLIPLLDPEVRARASKNAGITVKRRMAEDADYAVRMRKSLQERMKPEFTFAGKRHSEETKQKMRKPKNVGESNSQFGTCWVTNGKPIKIRKEQLDEYIRNGYSLGRKVLSVV